MRVYKKAGSSTVWQSVPEASHQSLSHQVLLYTYTIDLKTVFIPQAYKTRVLVGSPREYEQVQIRHMKTAE